MRKIILLLCILLTYGCAVMTYTAPDGTKVTYTRFCTGADEIKGNINGAKITVTGQKSVDAEVLKTVVGTAIEAAK